MIKLALLKSNDVGCYIWHWTSSHPTYSITIWCPFDDNLICLGSGVYTVLQDQIGKLVHTVGEN